MSEVKATLALLESKVPGRAIEVRIPPYAAIQCGDGPTRACRFVRVLTSHG